MKNIGDAPVIIRPSQRSLQDYQKLVLKVNHRRSLWTHPLDLFRVIRDYLPLGRYMRRRFGWKSWYSFWFTRFFVSDEGGEFDFSSLLLRHFPGLLRQPWKIEIEHTTVCNKQCIFCSHTHFKEPQQQMSFKDFAFLIDSIPRLKWLNLAGIGSFFLNMDAIRMLEYARMKHINVNFVDEFDFFTEEHARRVVDLGIQSIYVSFDAATKETYETIKKKCDYQKALSNLHTLINAKTAAGSPFPVLHFRFLISSLNYQEMPEFVNLVAHIPNRGARSRLEFIGLIPFPGIERYHLPVEKIPDELLIRTYQNALKNNINLYFSHSSTDLPSMNECVRWSEPFVLVNGNVISDCAILMQHPKSELKKFSFGNAFQQSFNEIWNSSAYRAFRLQVVKKNGAVPASCMNCCTFNTKVRRALHGIYTMSISPEKNHHQD